MRFRTDNTDAEFGTLRTRRFFAWFPVRVPWFDNHSNPDFEQQPYWVWLETVTMVERKGLDSRWYAIKEAP